MTADMTQVEHPLPRITPWSKPFCAAAQRGQLVAQFCPTCQRTIFYPKKFCSQCMGTEFNWVDVPLQGEVYTYTVVRAHPPREFEGDLPFVVAVVRLTPDVQLMTNIIGCPPEDVHCGMPVEAVFERANDEITLVKFRPRRGSKA
jgi:uncharacterized protein